MTVIVRPTPLRRLLATTCLIVAATGGIVQAASPAPYGAATVTQAQGSNADFHHSKITTASRAAIWARWTDPATWSEWDKGLKSARADKPLALGVTGQITPLSGPASSFTIVEWVEGESYAFETKLPLATLKVRRFFEPGDQTRFTHHVTFSGPMGGVWAGHLGPGFRQALPPTMEALATSAEAGQIEKAHRSEFNVGR